MAERNKKYDGYLMLVAAACLIWLGGYLREPLIADKRFLVASDQMKQQAFNKAVLFVQRHDSEGAVAFVVNKPSADPAFAMGGPVEEDKVAALYTSDINIPDGNVFDGLGIALGGETVVTYLRGSAQKPKWYLLLKGYAGWFPGQLDRELEQGRWKVIEYDLDLLTKTAADEMWAEAMKRPEAPLHRSEKVSAAKGKAAAEKSREEY